MYFFIHSPHVLLGLKKGNPSLTIPALVVHIFSLLLFVKAGNLIIVLLYFLLKSNWHLLLSFLYAVLIFET
jgi:hypothetical protein